MLYLEININTITVYGVGSGNTPALIVSAGHLRTVSYFLNYNVTHFQRSQTCDKYGRTII